MTAPIDTSAQDIRVGDFITLEMVVREVYPDHLNLSLKPMQVACEKGGGVEVAINRHSAKEHRPSDLQAGSHVRFATNPQSITGVIRTIIDDLAWVFWTRSEAPYHEVVALSLLARTPTGGAS